VIAGGASVLVCSTAMAAAAPDAKKEEKEEVVLYVKAGQDGKSLGDCPFSHKVNMALRMKDLDGNTLRVEPVNMQDKPEWFLKLSSKGSVPVLQMDEIVVADSEEALNKLDERFSPAVMPAPGASSDAERVVSQVFPAFVEYLKCDDDSDLPNKKDALNSALAAVNSHLASSAQPYMCGDAMSSLDCNLAPKLYHIQVAAAHYRQYEIPRELDALLAYMQRVFASDAFQRSAYSPDEVIWGWSKFF